MLVTAGTQLAPIVSEARTLGQFVAPAHQRLVARWRRTCGGAGTTTRRACSASSIRCCGASSDHNPVALLQQIPIEKLEERASELALHSRINYAYRRHAGVPAARSTPGAPGTPACSGPGRSPTSRPSSGCTSRCRSTPAASASWPAITSRARRISASRWSASASTTTRAISGSGSTATAGSTRTTSTSTTASCRFSRRRDDGDAGHRRDRDPHRHDRRARLAAGGRPQHAAAARFERRRQPARRPRADRAPLRRRQPRPHPPGAAARRRRRARARPRWASRRASCT